MIRLAICLLPLMAAAGTATAQDHGQHRPAQAPARASAPTPVQTSGPTTAPSADDPHAGHDMGRGMPPSSQSPDVDPHAGHDMGTTPVQAEDPHAGHDMGSGQDPADPYAGHDMGAMPSQPGDPHAGHDMSGMGAMGPPDVPTSASAEPAFGVDATTSVGAAVGAGATAAVSSRLQRLRANSNARIPSASSNQGSQLKPLFFSIWM